MCCLQVGIVRNLDIALALSSTETTITVESSTNQVNAADTYVQGIVDGKQTRDLPLNGRDWTTLATLNTGVSQILTQFPGAATATTRLSRGRGAQLTIGGNRPQQNSYRLDGVNINDYANGGPGSVSGATLGVDAVQEFSVITSDGQRIGGDTLDILGSRPFDFPDCIVYSRSCTRGHNINYIDTSCFTFPGTYSYAPGFADLVSVRAAATRLMVQISSFGRPV